MKNGKRNRITMATISVYGMRCCKKATNTLNWKVFLIDEPEVDKLIDIEKNKLVEKIQSKTQEIQIVAKVKEKKVFFVDTFLSWESEKIGGKGMVEKQIRVKNGNGNQN